MRHAFKSEGWGLNMSKPMRVVIWSTGSIGKIAIKSLMERPDIEIVGVWVHSEQKAGRDVGEIMGEGPIGIKATRDVDALIALKPDCVLYAANPPEREAVTVPDCCRLLAAGINVVTSSTTAAIYPPTTNPGMRQQLLDACAAGGSSFYASGVEPGFAADHLPLVLATQSSRITKVHATEIAIYAGYPVAFDLMEGMGFGRSLDFEPYLAKPGGILMNWGGSVQMIADALGVKLDEMREVYDRRPTPRPLDVAIGTLEAGSCGVVRIQAIGVVNGRDAIIVEHVNRMAHDLAPEWAACAEDVGYRIEITGVPNILCNMSFSIDEARKAATGAMKEGAGGMVATAMRVANAIPYVVNAAPGFYGALDLPLTVPQGAFASAG